MQHTPTRAYRAHDSSPNKFECSLGVLTLICSAAWGTSFFFVRVAGLLGLVGVQLGGIGVLWFEVELTKPSSFTNRTPVALNKKSAASSEYRKGVPPGPERKEGCG